MCGCCWESPCSSSRRTEMSFQQLALLQKIKKKNTISSLFNRLQPASVCARAKLADQMHCEMIDGTFRWRRRPVGRRALCESRPTWLMAEALRCTPAILPTLLKDASGWNFPAAPIQRGPHPLVARKRAFPPRRHPLPSTTTPRTNPASRGRDVTRLPQHRLCPYTILILSRDGRRGQGPGSDRPRQVGDLARRHVHHRRHVAVTPRFSIFLAPLHRRG